MTFSYLVYDVVNELIRFDAGEVVFINKLLQQLKQSLLARNFQHWVKFVSSWLDFPQGTTISLDDEENHAEQNLYNLFSLASGENLSLLTCQLKILFICKHRFV